MIHKDLIKADKNAAQLPNGQLVWLPPGYALSTETSKPEPESHLWDYIWMIWCKRWLVFLMFLFCVGLAVLKNYSSTPVYTAVAQLKLEPEDNKVISFQGDQVAFSNSNKEDFINTQIQIISGRELVSKVLARLGSDVVFVNAQQPGTPEDKKASDRTDKEKPTSSVDRIWMAFKKSVGLAPDVRLQTFRPNSPEEKEYKALIQQIQLNYLMSMLNVGKMKDADIVLVSYSSPDPHLSAKLVNTLCDEYIKWTYTSRYESYSYARNFLKEKLDEMKAKLEKSENDMLVLTGGQEFVAGPEGQLPAQLESYRQKIIDAERVVFEKQFALQKFTTDKSYAALNTLNDAHLNQLLDRYSTDQINYDSLTTQLGAGSKEVRQLKGELAGIEKQLKDAMAQIKGKAKFEYDQAKANCDLLQQQYDAEKKRISGIQKNMIQYNILKREVDSNRELYNALLQRWKEVGVASGIKAGYVSVIEPALSPLIPSSPNKPRTLLLGAFMGLFMGIGLVFFIDYMDTSVKDLEELESIARLPILGFVPHCNIKLGKDESRFGVELLTHFRPRSELAESIRSIRTSIQYSRAGGAPRTIMVTSCLPSEGKTTVATNLAIALAQRGKRVLLIDADLKKPSLHKLFSVAPNLGLAEVLTGKSDGTNIPETEISNLSVMPSGTKVPNPVELLDSDLMRQFLESALKEFDHIVIDATPALNMADSSVLAPYVDGIILVVQPGKTPRAAVRRVKERVIDVQGNILGLVVNNPAKGAETHLGPRYGYSFNYGTKYGYGYGQDRVTGRNFRRDRDKSEGYVKEIMDISVAERQIDTPEANLFSSNSKDETEI